MQPAIFPHDPIVSVYPLLLDGHTARREAQHARRLGKPLPVGHPYRRLPLWLPYWLARSLNLSAPSSRPQRKGAALDATEPGRAQRWQASRSSEGSAAVAVPGRGDAPAPAGDGIATVGLVPPVLATGGRIDPETATKDRGQMFPNIAQGAGSRLQMAAREPAESRIAKTALSIGERHAEMGYLRVSGAAGSGVRMTFASPGPAMPQVRVTVSGGGVTQLGEGAIETAQSARDRGSIETTGPRRRTELSSLKPPEGQIQELRKIHATLHSAMDALIKDLNGNEAARLLILMDDRLTTLINELRGEPHGPFADHLTFKGEIPAEFGAAAAERGEGNRAPARMKGDAGGRGEGNAPAPERIRAVRGNAEGGRPAAAPGAPAEPTPFARRRAAAEAEARRPSPAPHAESQDETAKSEPVGEGASPPAAADEPPGFLPFKPVPVKFTRRVPPPPPAAEAEPPPPLPAEAHLAEEPVEDEPHEDAPRRRWAEPAAGVFGRFRSKFDALLKSRHGAARTAEPDEHDEEAQPHSDEPAEHEPVAAVSSDAAEDDRSGTEPETAPPAEPEKAAPPADLGLTAVMRALDLSAGSAPAREPEPVLPQLPVFELPPPVRAAEPPALPEAKPLAAQSGPTPPVAKEVGSATPEAKPESLVAPEAMSAAVSGASNVSDVNVRRLHNVADLSAALDILGEAARKTGNRIELRKVEEGLDLVVKGIPKPLGTVRLSASRASHVVYQPLFGLDIPSREPNRADLELWMTAMGDVVVRILDNITQRRKGRPTDAKAEAPPPKDVSSV